jgi:hypothetical protein
VGAQARHLFEEGVDQIRAKASVGRQNLADGLGQLPTSFAQMFERTDGSGMAADLLQQVT